MLLRFQFSFSSRGNKLLGGDIERELDMSVFSSEAAKPRFMLLLIDPIAAVQCCL